MQGPMVYIVGAGPGDPKLITLKGVDCIKKADVLIYDRLVDTRLLSYASSHTEVIFAGKWPDNHTLAQEEISRLMVDRAKAGKTVTRLKGGDPFVFGRGGEEGEALFENNIPFEIVPGITSAVSVPMHAGIPVTFRKIASSFTVVTGHEDPSKGMSDVDFENLARNPGTLVFLMGMGNLSLIVERLIEYGKRADTPVAVIRRGTTPGQKTLVGKLCDIADRVNEQNFQPPAVIVVGDVVVMREKLCWFEKKPLFGKKILVTRPAEQAGRLSEKIMELGGEPVEIPTIKIVPPDSFEQVDAAVEKIEQYDWIIFTSVNGVEHFFKRLIHLKRDARSLKGIKLCAIGPKTGEKLQCYGLIADFIPEEFNSTALAEGFKHKKPEGLRILLPRADIAPEFLSDALKEMGALVDSVCMYKTVTDDKAMGTAAGLLKEKDIDVITFTSSSTVRNLVESLNPGDLNSLLARAQVASIGPVTSETAQRYGIKVDIEAREHTIDGLLEAILMNAEV